MSKEDNFHRIALEPRSGIWLLFYETKELYNIHYSQLGLYKQQLVRIFTNFDKAEEAAMFMIADRKISCPLIVRDDSHRNEMMRG